MMPIERTPRQRIIDLITGTRLSSHQLAQMLGLPERQVGEHLTHVVKTIAHDKTRLFILDPARCQYCEFVFRDRPSDEPKPLPSLSKRSHRSAPLWHRSICGAA
jgi:transcriptional regulator